MWAMAQQFLQKKQFFWKKNQRGLRNGKIWRGTPWTNEKVAFGHHIRRSMKDHAVFHIDLGWLVIQNKVDWKRGAKCTHLCTFYSQLIIIFNYLKALLVKLHWNTIWSRCLVTFKTDYSIPDFSHWKKFNEISHLIFTLNCLNIIQK